MDIRIKVVSLEKAKEIDNVIMWEHFAPLYYLPEEIFGKELDATIAPESATTPWFCYYADELFYKTKNNCFTKQMFSFIKLIIKFCKTKN